MIVCEISNDSKGDLLPKNLKLEHLIKIGDAALILSPEKYIPGLIVRCPLNNDERVVFMHSEEIFKQTINDFKDVEILLNWAHMDIELAKKLSGFDA